MRLRFWQRPRYTVTRLAPEPYHPVRFIVQARGALSAKEATELHAAWDAVSHDKVQVLPVGEETPLSEVTA